jgi:DNA-binding transcriptional LysR family regulator
MMSNILFVINLYTKSMSMELRHLRYFIAVAEELHFGRAAARLHMAQPPLSHQIRQLEEELSVPLFHRTKRRVQLTDAGQVFLDEARRTLTQAQHAIRAAQRAHRGEIGRLVVGFVYEATVGILPDMLRVFRERFPEVELALHEMTTAPQLKDLHTRRLDVGFLHPPLDDDTLKCEILHRAPLVAILPQHHDLASRKRIPMQLLACEPFILQPYTRAYGARDQVVRMCQSAGFVPDVVQEATQIVTIASLVAAGIGVSIVPISAQTLRAQGVVYRPIRDQTVMRDLAIAWHCDNRSSVLKAFLEVVRERQAQNG